MLSYWKRFANKVDLHFPFAHYRRFSAYKTLVFYVLSDCGSFLIKIYTVFICFRTDKCLLFKITTLSIWTPLEGVLLKFFFIEIQFPLWLIEVCDKEFHGFFLFPDWRRFGNEDLEVVIHLFSDWKRLTNKVLRSSLCTRIDGFLLNALGLMELC